eukprot:4858236-Pleurochrysis_carterae.AAC.1
MFVFAVVITYFEFGTLALRIPESSNPTRVRFTSQVVLQKADFCPLCETTARTILTSARLFGSACAFVLETDKRCHDYVYSTLFGLEPRAQRHPASRQPEPSHRGTPESTHRRKEPCPKSLIAHAQALYASHRKLHSGKHDRTLSPGMRSVGFIVDSGCSWHVHPHAEDLVETRPCTEEISGVDGKAHRCTLVGDMP